MAKEGEKIAGLLLTWLEASGMGETVKTFRTECLFQGYRPRKVDDRGKPWMIQRLTDAVKPKAVVIQKENSMVHAQVQTLSPSPKENRPPLLAPQESHKAYESKPSQPVKYLYLRKREKQPHRTKMVQQRLNATSPRTLRKQLQAKMEELQHDLKEEEETSWIKRRWRCPAMPVAPPWNPNVFWKAHTNITRRMQMERMGRIGPLTTRSHAILSQFHHGICPVAHIEGHRDLIHGLYFIQPFSVHDQDGGRDWIPVSMLISLSWDDTIRLWSIGPRGQWFPETVLQGPDSLTDAVVLDQQLRVVCCSYQGRVAEYDLLSGECVRTLCEAVEEEENDEEPTGPQQRGYVPASAVEFHCMAYSTLAHNPKSSKMSSMLAVGASDSQVFLWTMDGSSSPYLLALKDLGATSKAEDEQTIRSLCFHPSGNTLLCCGANGIACVDLRSGQVAWTVPTHHPVDNVIVSPSGERFFTSSRTDRLAAYGCVTGRKEHEWGDHQNPEVMDGTEAAVATVNVAVMNDFLLVPTRGNALSIYSHNSKEAICRTAAASTCSLRCAWNGPPWSTQALESGVLFASGMLFEENELYTNAGDNKGNITLWGNDKEMIQAHAQEE